MIWMADPRIKSGVGHDVEWHPRAVQQNPGSLEA